jgi:hypothetical protein
VRLFTLGRLYTFCLALVFACAAVAGALFPSAALAQLQLDQQPSGQSPSQPRIQIAPQLQPFQPQPFPFDQLNRTPQRAPQRLPQRGGVTASAVFDPPILRLMRFGEYRVTITGATSGIELPDPLTTPEGLILELTEKTPTINVVNGQRTVAMTFRYTATTARAGTFVMPSFTANVAGTAVTVPAAQLTVQEPGPADLPYQSATAVLDLQDGDYYVGQMLPARLLVFDTADEAVQAIANITKPSGDFLFQSQSGSRRDRVMWQGKMQSAMVTPLRLIPIKPGESEISVQAIVFVTRLTSIGRSSGNTSQAMLDTPPVRVRVRPLPEAGRKPGFTGAIGKFELGKPTLSASEVAVGDPLTLTVEVTGEGNLESISPPALDGGEAWQTFTPTVEVDRDAFSARGSKSFHLHSDPAKYRRALCSRDRVQLLRSGTSRVHRSLCSTGDGEREAEWQRTAGGHCGGSEDRHIARGLRSTEARRPALILTGLAEKPGMWRSSQLRCPPGAVSGSLNLYPEQPSLDYGFGEGGRTISPRTRKLSGAELHVRQHDATSSVRVTQCDARIPKASSNRAIAAIRAAAAPLDSTEAESLVLQEVLVKIPAADRNIKARETIQRLFDRSHAKEFSGHPVEANGVFSLLPEVEQTITTIERRQP